MVMHLLSVLVLASIYIPQLFVEGFMYVLFVFVWGSFRICVLLYL
jgi:hypothetical protein